MKLLLDTHALLWWLFDDPRLPEKARTAIGNDENTVFFSVASIWEISIKKALGKLRLPDEFYSVLPQSGFQKLVIDIEHARMIENLPLHHHDPFDRMLIAQAVCENLYLLSKDLQLADYGIAIIWR